ncbi:hypothetical protein SMGD1_2762 [Sulfurimonas gotlandica GD1]|uniref:RNase H type-1 domain-containing protein n=1 Tax=Sulfurimonas gotlandica (strain DSM 19862 / JCM 16533 / GD1) TaxID=929558 RepID=H1FTH5_SULGG|nr:RNase H family protein [Sulfurimonas gotlandica]EHP31284.1 hypothetical protein SMGD1_2762 [Sulfurimonas gotlandica GD1]
MQTTSHKPTLYLFTDASVNPQAKIGFGAYILLDEEKISSAMFSKDDVKSRKFENTSSTKLELETLLWALNDIPLQNNKIIIFTDCQNIIGLNDRRERFEKNNYLTSKNKLIKNHELYKEFFKITDTADCDLIKVKGHKKHKDKDMIDNIFTLVDKASRDALREAVL